MLFRVLKHGETLFEYAENHDFGRTSGLYILLYIRRITRCMYIDIVIGKYCSKCENELSPVPR